MPTSVAQAKAGMPPMGEGENSRGTPADIYDPYNAIHHFTLDAAAAHDNTKTARYCTIEGTYHIEVGGIDVVPIFEDEHDGLTQSWQGETVWVNPPYGRGVLAPFVAKAHNETRVVRQDGGGDCIVVMLLPANRTEQDWWHRYVWDNERGRPRPGVSIDYPKRRIRYDGLSAGAPFASCLVTFKGLKR